MKEWDELIDKAADGENGKFFPFRMTDTVDGGDRTGSAVPRGGRFRRQALFVRGLGGHLPRGYRGQ